MMEESQDDLENEVREHRKKIRELREKLQDSLRGGFVEDLRGLAVESA